MKIQVSCLKIRLIFLENLKNNKQLLSTVTLAEILKFIEKRFELQFFFKLAIMFLRVLILKQNGLLHWKLDIVA